MNTATIYDLTAKEYMHLGKVGNGWFQMSNEKIISFLTRVKYGAEIKIMYDSDGEPDNFWDDEEYIKWKEIDTWDGSPPQPHLNKLNCTHKRITAFGENTPFCIDCDENLPGREPNV